MFDSLLEALFAGLLEAFVSVVVSLALICAVVFGGLGLLLGWWIF